MPQLNYNFASDYFNQWNSAVYTLRRKTATKDEHGYEVFTDNIVDDITASVQPFNKTRTENLPEADKESIVFEVFTNYDDLRKDDYLIVDNNRYMFREPSKKWVFGGVLHHYVNYLYEAENEN